MNRSLSAPSAVDRSDGFWGPVVGLFSKDPGSTRPTTEPMLRAHGAGGTVRVVEEKFPVVSPPVSEVGEDSVYGSCPGCFDSQRWRCEVPCLSTSISAANVMKDLRSSFDRVMRSQGSVAPDAMPRTSSESCPSSAHTPQGPRSHVVQAVQPEVSVRRWFTSTITTDLTRPGCALETRRCTCGENGSHFSFYRQAC
jgi:hypothetical protein